LHGADRPDSLRGVGLDFVVLDEYADMSAETWQTVVRPMLSDRVGSAILTGTPRGFDHFYELYMAAKSKENWAAFHFPTEEDGYVPRDELAIARTDLDPRRYAQEYCASFENLQGRVYHEFDREQNVSNLTPLPNANLLIGMDFNIAPMTAVVAQRAGDQCQIVDEIVLTNSNTQEMMQELNRRYAGRQGQGVVYPDPSGVARKTSAPVGQTDFTIIRRAGWRVYTPPEPYPMVDRINSVNAMLCNAQGQRRLLISPKCVHLIKALDGLTYKEDTKIPDKNSGLDHITDALGYLIMGAFPMITRTWRSEEFW
jgi:terminase large subunit-like protein